ncbi:8-oxo-dGTP pyrophosphatase MutT (NUDIX family) [Sphingomonas kaistensis]|uniref:8-oxo-dGTP pyrophosphatase MutT (NUDIX family) n=1 Tax=Sphingomonas kaistensis TaxID=298708 RepID=A0A7X6BEZ5_9SPHN|nr:NUDIX domain-containing protein [Sphingomonas kaistensis]NJC04824.1 8-oxo-dGTP pyrophosphatase MutT (NUDIX family) [Sphingomonas kaistensis]
MNRFLQFGWSLRRRLIGLLRIRTRGVKVMLFNSRGELLLIRNGYGDTGLFVLPGGGVGRREEPLAAARRELAEEVGIAGADLRHLGDYKTVAEGKRDRVSLFHGSSDQPLRIDGREVSEAGFFPPGDLPQAASPATRRRVREWVAGGPFGGAW